jgi:TonB family protein
MYDDLARTQETPLLERFVMTSILPSLLITSFLHASDVWGRREPPPRPVGICILCRQFCIQCAAFPVLETPIEERAPSFPDSRSPDVHVGIAGVLQVERDDEGARYWQSGDWGALPRVGGAAPEYPELLRGAGVEGRVVVEAVVDSLGRVEPRSLLVVAFTHPGFVTAVQRAAIAMRFEPFRVDGQAMRVRIMVPIDFRLRAGRLKA